MHKKRKNDLAKKRNQVKKMPEKLKISFKTLEKYLIDQPITPRIGQGRLYKVSVTCKVCGHPAPIIEDNPQFQRRVCTNPDCQAEYKSRYIYPDSTIRIKDVELKISPKLIPLCPKCGKEMELIMEETEYFHLRCINCRIVIGGKLYDIFQFDNTQEGACPLCGCTMFEDSQLDGALHCANCFLIVDPNILDK